MYRLIFAFKGKHWFGLYLSLLGRDWSTSIYPNGGSSCFFLRDLSPLFERATYILLDSSTKHFTVKLVIFRSYASVTLYDLPLQNFIDS